MDGQLGDFSSASMYDFQTMVEAYKKRNGIKEEDITTTEDLDDLYSAAGHRMAENPEAWH